MAAVASQMKLIPRKGLQIAATFLLTSCSASNPVVLDYSRFHWGVSSAISVRSDGDASWTKSGESGTVRIRCQPVPEVIIEEAVQWHAQAEPSAVFQGYCEDGGSRTLSVTLDGVSKSATLDECPTNVPKQTALLMGKIAERFDQCLDEFYSVQGSQ